MTGTTLAPATALCGRSIRAILAERHFYQGEGTETIEIWIDADGLDGLSLTGSPSGWGLVVGHIYPKSLDLGQYGEVRVLDLSDELGIGSSRRKVERVLAVQSDESTEPFGLALVFGPASILHVLNRDDELVLVEGEVPELAQATYRDLCRLESPR